MLGLEFIGLRGMHRAQRGVSRRMRDGRAMGRRGWLRRFHGVGRIRKIMIYDDEHDLEKQATKVVGMLLAQDGKVL